MMDIRISPYKNSQIDQIDDLIIRSICSLNSNVFTKDEIKELCETQPLSMRPFDERLCFVAVYQKKICGVIIIRRTKEATQIFQIMGLFVHPDFARQGVGKKLVNFAERISIYLGAKAILVLASKASLKFYVRNSYTETTSRDGATQWLGSVWFYKALIEGSFTIREHAMFALYLLTSKLRNLKLKI